ncbi:uncharacterized protein LOC124126964 isoform X1 [Haliotis rufescens]|uniref:uncharacterized protein LOC124126964 isoform X1 n=1 Tax=Haliotis rufescens TaxID=6454 RepID=UPI00201EA75E|nr:uncharacterized protein LOC124126964 isoform X1 [Haliotis rufescens]XP_046346445.2 uncharacterized protein LOC124126964 isoform X1 [Haliotis rufescens]
MTTTRLAVVCFLYSLHLMVLGDDVKDVKPCTSDANTTFSITCPEQEMMYFIDTNVQEMTDDCKPGSCSTRYYISSDTDCTGVRGCNKTVRKSWVEDSCNKANFYQPTLLYECISETPLDICSLGGVASGPDSYLYLKSPNYPGNYTVDYPNKTCTCEIRGAGMTMQVIEALIQPRANDTDKYTMTAGSIVHPRAGEVNTVSGLRYSGTNPFSAWELKNVKQVQLVYNAGGKEGKDGNYLWMRVKGTSATTVSCNGAPHPSAPAPTNTVRPTNTVSPTNKAAPTYTGHPKLTLTSLVAMVTAVVMSSAA